MVPRTEPQSGGRFEPPQYSLFHQISAIEAFIDNNNGEGCAVTRLTHLTHHDEIIALVIYHAEEEDQWVTIRARQLCNIPQIELRTIGIEELAYQFEDSDLYVSDANPDSPLDPVIYDTQKGQAYSVGASLEEEDPKSDWQWENEINEIDELTQGYGET